MSLLITIPLAIWITWAVGNLALVLTAPWWATEPCTNGLVVIIPPDSVATLTPDEIDAVRWHERGHMALWHMWHNLARAMVFAGRSKYSAQMQELDADDYAIQHCDPIDLASALDKLSTGAFDAYRVRRLVRVAQDRCG